MGCRKATEEEVPAAEETSLGEALLFATMCIIGLPVEVQVKDGSVYSGIFHTASVEKDYGIVLKKAMKIGTGKSDTNLAVGALVDTLVVLSDDLVQVVAKGVVLPGEGIVGNAADNGTEAINKPIGYQVSSDFVETKPGRLNSSNTCRRCLCQNEAGSDTMIEREDVDGRNISEKPFENTKVIENRNLCRKGSQQFEGVSCATVISISERETGEDRLQGDKDLKRHIDDAHLDKMGDKIGHEVCISISGAVKQEPPNSKVPTATCFPSSESTSSGSAFSSSTSPSPSPSPGIISVPNTNSIHSTSSKGFKLNPGAKNFLPSYTSSMPAPHTSLTVASMPYVPNAPALVPVVGTQQAVEISSFAGPPSMSAKFIQYNNMGAPNDNNVQYPRPIISHLATGQQPARFTTPFHPAQGGATYLHPNSQTTMGGRLGQVVYVHPVPQDAIQGTPTLPEQTPPPLLTPYPANLSKLPGNAPQPQPLQICVAPPVIAGGRQPFMIPSPIPISHPLHMVQPIPVPGGTNVFGSKFY